MKAPRHIFGAFLVCSLALPTACEKKKNDDPVGPDTTTVEATNEKATEKKKDGSHGAGDGTVIVSEAITDNLAMLTGKGGNIAVLFGDDGILIVDDQFADLAPQIKERITTVTKLKPDAIEFVLNTHFHGDHTGGNKVFGKDAHIVAHKNVRQRLIAGDEPSHGLPVVTYDREMGLHFNGEDIRLVHLPGGHTDGDSAVFFAKANTVHLGDNFFNRMLPFVDLDSGGSPAALLASTEKLLKSLKPDVTIIPGHGKLAKLADYQKFRDMLVDTIGVVRSAKKAGKTLEQVEAAGFGGKYKAWETSFVNENRWAQTIYKSL